MAVAADRLVEILPKDLSTLKNLYKSAENDSRTHIAYESIDVYIRWLEQDSNASTYIKFYCLNGDFSDGTFIVTKRLRAYADTLNDSFDNLHRLLQLVDYSKGYFFLSIRSRLRQVFKEAFEKANAKIAYEYINLLYHLPKETALKFSTKREGIDLRPITELHDLEKIDSVWSLRSAYTLAYLQRLAKYCLNVGAFKKDGTLVAWVFRYTDGMLGVLQTDEKYKGQGYGSLVVKAFSKKVAELDQDIYIEVNENNQASRALFERLGATSIGHIYCIVTENAWNADKKLVNT